MLLAFTVLFIVDPVALVLGTVRMRVLAEAMRLVILPVPVIYVAVGVYQPATTVCLVVFPVSFVYASVTPDLVASSMSLFCLCVPFTFVLCTVRKSYHVFLLPKHTGIVIFVRIQTVDELWESFSDSLHALPLLLEPLWVHLDVYCTTI